MLSLILTLLLLPLFLASLYLVVLSLGAFLFKPIREPNSPALSIGVMIPAHNEEHTLPEAIHSIHKANYPKHQLDLFVIADRCSDRTATIAKELGATVIERPNTSKQGKGPALNDFLTLHKDLYAHCDVIALIDADTIVDENFFSEVSASISSPDIDIVQGQYRVFNDHKSWLTGITSAAFIASNHLRMAGKAWLGASVGIKGNGIAFRSEILRKTGWPCDSIVEDLGMGLELLKSGHRIHYNDRAIVSSEMPLNTKQASSQRQRWEQGRFELVKKEALPLIKLAVKEKSLALFESAIDLLTPPLSIIVAGCTCGLVVSSFITGGGLPLNLSALSLLGLVLHVSSGLIQARAPLHIWLSLGAVPFFILFKLLLYLRMLGKGRQEKWIRTKRTNEIIE